jgi:hypothetical protein
LELYFSKRFIFFQKKICFRNFHRQATAAAVLLMVNVNVSKVVVAIVDKVGTCHLLSHDIAINFAQRPTLIYRAYWIDRSISCRVPSNITSVIF